MIARLDRLALGPSGARTAASAAAASPALAAMAAAAVSTSQEVERERPQDEERAQARDDSAPRAAAPERAEADEQPPLDDAPAAVAPPTLDPPREVTNAAETRGSWRSPPQIFPNDPPLKLDLPPEPASSPVRAQPNDEPARPQAQDEDVDWLSESLSGAATADAAAKPAPRIVGRYQAGGVDYVMYSDGSIEAGHGEARQRFATLADLKAFIGET
ncbi:MAG: hypothetical protein IPL88_15475 [Rhizobiales bacterium]|nr:hypothetical protein [Hyphomicrobiales bacterium]